MFQLQSNGPIASKEYINFYLNKLKQGILLSNQDLFKYFEYDSGKKTNQDLFIKWFDDLFQCGFIFKYVNTFEEIFISPDQIWIKETNQRISYECSYEKDDLLLLMLYLSLKHKQKWSYLNPFASFFASIGNHYLRITLLHPSTNKNQEPRIFIRSIKANIFPLTSFFDNPNELQAVLNLMQNKKSLLIAGSTGSGKTSMMSSLLSIINQDEHLVILEDTYEIQYNSSSYVSRFLATNEENKSLEEYCAYALRMSPDRLVLGELRSNEVVPFLLAMNTGHSGLISTIHANSAIDSLKRVALLFSIYTKNKSLSFETVLKMASQGVDYVLFVRDKKAQELIKILGASKENVLYEKCF